MGKNRTPKKQSKDMSSVLLTDPWLYAFNDADMQNFEKPNIPQEIGCLTSEGSSQGHSNAGTLAYTQINARTHTLS